jgi:hypothetical protein
VISPIVPSTTQLLFGGSITRENCQPGSGRGYRKHSRGQESGVVQARALAAAVRPVQAEGDLAGWACPVQSGGETVYLVQGRQWALAARVLVAGLAMGWVVMVDRGWA